MSPIITQEKRTIYRLKIEGFLEGFRRNRLGVLGIILLLVYIIAGLFAPWLSPYDPQQSQLLADAYAMPGWMKIFPQFSDYPNTINVTANWVVQQKTDSMAVEWGKTVNMVFNTTDTSETAEMIMNATFNYPYSVPPQRFVVTYDLLIGNITNTWYYAEMVIVNQAGNSTRIWILPFTDATTEVSPIRDSSDAWLVKELGYSDPKAVNVARSHVFTAPVKGTYTLAFHLYFRPDEGAPFASATATLGNAQVWIPGLVHGILGTDFLGTDVFSQLIHGAKISLAIGLLAAGLETSIGILIGVISGYTGGLVDEALMRIVDILLCLPVLPLLLTLVFVFGKNVFYIVILIGVFGWQGLARTIRSQVLVLRESSFVESAVASGAGKYYIMIRHIVPNIFPIAISSLVLSVPAAILTEAGLSFLGFGDPRTPTWGKMLNQAFGFGAFEKLAWWVAIPPGLAITFLSLAFVFMGYAIDEIVNPRLRRRR